MERPVLSPDPPLLTLDTSCISALAKPQTSVPVAEVEALDALVDGAQVGALRLQLTASYERDFERWTDTAGREQRSAWLASAPTMARVGGIFRLDASVWDGRDVLAGDDDVDLDRRLRGILVPSLKLDDVPGHDEAPGEAAKAFSDIDHLIAHRRSGALLFVTLDVKTILRRAARLAELAINVCLPTDAEARLVSTRDRPIDPS